MNSYPLGKSASELSTSIDFNVSTDAMCMITYKSDIGGSLGSFILTAYDKHFTLWQDPVDKYKMALVVDCTVKTVNVGW